MIGRITKFRLSKDGVEVHWFEAKGKTEKETIYRSKEQVHPDLLATLAILSDMVRGVLDLHTGSYKKLAVRGVSFTFSEDTQIEGAVITSEAKLNIFSAPMILNTPHATLQELPPTIVNELTSLRREIALYVDGKRAQLELVAAEMADAAAK